MLQALPEEAVGVRVKGLRCLLQHAKQHSMQQKSHVLSQSTL